MSALNQLIAPEIIGDDFHAHIQDLASRADVHTVLEIGSSSGDGSTAAFVAGLRNNPNRPRLFCLEISKPRYEALCCRYAADSFVHCYNASAVAPREFPTEEAVRRFYHSTPTNLNSYPLERVLGWLRQDVEYVRGAGVPSDGIERIRRENGIDVFDMVLIDGSEFTGPAELAKVYGAKYVLLDDINTFKNHANHRRLLDDPNYELIAEDATLRNGYAIFRRGSPVRRTTWTTALGQLQ